MANPNTNVWTAGPAMDLNRNMLMSMLNGPSFLSNQQQQPTHPTPQLPAHLLQNQLPAPPKWTPTPNHRVVSPPPSSSGSTSMPSDDFHHPMNALLQLPSIDSTESLLSSEYLSSEFPPSGDGSMRAELQAISCLSDDQLAVLMKSLSESLQPQPQPLQQMIAGYPPADSITDQICMLNEKLSQLQLQRQQMQQQQSQQQQMQHTQQIQQQQQQILMQLKQQLLYQEQQMAQVQQLADAYQNMQHTDPRMQLGVIPGQQPFISNLQQLQQQTLAQMQPVYAASAAAPPMGTSHLGQYTSLAASLAALNRSALPGGPMMYNSAPTCSAGTAGRSKSQTGAFLPSLLTRPPSEKRVVSADFQAPGSRFPHSPVHRQAASSLPTSSSLFHAPCSRSPMTRGSRRQLNSILDDFWGKFYDLHGHPVYEHPSVSCLHPSGSSRLCGEELYLAVKACVKAMFEVDGAVSLLEGGVDGDPLVRASNAPSMALHSAVVSALRLPDADTLVQQLCAADATGGHSAFANLPITGADAAVEFDWNAMGAATFMSFGVWCLFTLLTLCQVEARPELWGKFAYVLNKLQSFLSESSPDQQDTRSIQRGGGKRVVLSHSHLANVKVDIAQNLIMLELSLAEKKGPARTAAGEVAFPKGKEIMQSVIKRYRRKLGISESARAPLGAPMPPVYATFANSKRSSVA